MTTNTQVNNAISITPIGLAIAKWDANVNLSAAGFIPGYATTATGGTTTTLTVGSAQQQYFTGSTTQTLVMPVASTLAVGQYWTVVNNSSGVITIQSSGGNTILALPATSETVVTCVLASGTTAASWVTSPAISGSGTVSSGLINQLAWYAASGTAVSGLATANNGLLVTSAAGVPSISTTTPAGLTIPQPIINGIITVSAAAAGVVGEIISSTITAASATNYTPSGSIQNLTSITLTAGDWDVYGCFGMTAGVQLATLQGGLSLVSAGLPNLETRAFAAFPAGVVNGGVTAQPMTVNVSTSTIVYLVVDATFTNATIMYGQIYARRRR